MVPAISRVALPTGEAAIAMARARERLWRKTAIAKDPKSAADDRKGKGHGGGKPQVIPEIQEGLLLTLRAHGWSYREIGEFFGCSRHAVESAMGRAERRSGAAEALGGVAK